MKRFKNISKATLKMTWAIALGVVLVGAGATGASAQEVSDSATATFTLNQGQLGMNTATYTPSTGNTVDPNTDADGANGNDGAETAVYEMGSWTQDVGDIRGTGAGWSVQLSATPFTEVAEPTTELDPDGIPDSGDEFVPNVIPSGMTVSAYNETGVQDLNSGSEELTTSYDGVAYIDNGSPVTMTTATNNTGYGIYNLAGTINFEIADDQELVNSQNMNASGTTSYASTITSTIVVAP